MIVKAIPDANDFLNGGTCPRRQDFIGSDQCTVNIRHHQAYIFRRFFCLLAIESTFRHREGNSADTSPHTPRAPKPGSAIGV